MKALFLGALIVAGGLSNPVQAATYDDNNLDTEVFDCMAGLRDSGEYPKVRCQFSGDEVILNFAEDNIVRATMPSKELPTDGSPVIAMDQDGTAWQFTFVVPPEWSEDN